MAADISVMIENGPDEGPVARWATPDYEVVETALEVTAYFTTGP